MNRPSWDDHFLNLAEATAEMSTCGRLKVGAVLVDPSTKEIVSSGFNGSPRGHSHCTNKTTHISDGGCLDSFKRCMRTIHAEHNAILHAKRDVRGMTMYCTHEPCENCTKYMAQVGISRVVFRHNYENAYNKYFNFDMQWEHHLKEEVK